MLLLYFLLLFQSVGSIQPAQESLTIMTYNIHHGANKQEELTLDSMGLFIKESGADIIGLQEVDSVCNRSGKTDQMKRLAEITGMHYAFVRHFAFQGGAYGQGILSRYPIKNIENIRLSLLKPDSLRQSLALITGEIEVPNKGIVLFANAHFSLDALTRLQQAKEVLAYLKEKKLPAIFVGDLNATPDQEEIRLLQKKLLRVSGLNQPSFPTEAPVKTIDYIFINRQMKAKTEHTHVPIVPFSDHLPVISGIQF